MISLERSIIYENRLCEIFSHMNSDFFERKKSNTKFIHLRIDFKCTWTNLSSQHNTTQHSTALSRVQCFFLLNLCNDLYSYCGNITVQSVYIAQASILWHINIYTYTYNHAVTVLAKSKAKQLNEHLVWTLLRCMFHSFASFKKRQQSKSFVFVYVCFMCFDSVYYVNSPFYLLYVGSSSIVDRNDRCLEIKTISVCHVLYVLVLKWNFK